MSSIDIRNEDSDEVTEIVFAEKYDEGCFVSPKEGHVLTKYSDNGDSYLCIGDDEDSQIIINSKEHAQNLIKALNKAIELGWVK